jgi:hypothetical protein
LELEIASAELAGKDMMIQTGRLSNMVPIARKEVLAKISSLKQEVAISRF